MYCMYWIWRMYCICWGVSCWAGNPPGIINPGCWPPMPANSPPGLISHANVSTWQTRAWRQAELHELPSN